MPDVLAWRSLPRRAVTGLALAGAVLVAAAAVWYSVNLQATRRRVPAPQPRFSLFPPPLQTFNHLAVAPDGRAVVYAAGPTLHLRRLDAIEPRPITNTQGAYDPFWSPDGQWIAFFAGSELKKIALNGGRPQTLAGAHRGKGGSWSGNGDIVFAADGGNAVYRLPAGGGDPIPIRRAGERPGWTSVLWPHVLPDGTRFLYLVHSDNPDVQGIYIGDLRLTNAQQDVRVTSGESNVFYSTGHLAFVRYGTLHAQPFDLGTGRVMGPAFPITERIDQDSYDDGFAMFAISPNGVLAYRGGRTPDRQFRWFDRAGRQVSALDVAGEYRDLALSRNGHRLAYEMVDGQSGARDIWIRELDRDAHLRLTASPDEERSPVWAPDGKSLIFGSVRNRQVVLVRSSAAGGTEEELKGTIGVASDWSPDGKQVALEVERPQNGTDIMLLSLDERHALVPYLATPYVEREAQFSPDGRLMAYSSSESRQREVYIEPIPRTGQRWKISADFGREPRWRGDGRELYYLGREDTVTAVPLHHTAEGMEVGTPVSLFKARIRGADVRFHYAVTADGQRFLINTVVEDAQGTPINVWVYWLSGLAKGTTD